MSRRKVLLGVSGSWILTLTRVGSGLVAMPLYFHYVEAKMLGAWMLFVSMSGFFMVTDLGIAMVFSRELAFKSGERAQTGAAGVQAAADLYASVSRIYWIMGAAVFFIGGALGWAYLGGLDLGEGLSQARQAWLIYALGTCFVLAGSTPNYALQGLGDLGVEALANSLATVLGLAATFAALHRGGGVLAMALIFSAQALGTRLVLTQLLRRRHAWLFEVQGAYVAGTLKKILKTTLPLFITRMGALFVFQINPLLIAWILGAAALPDYVVLVTLASYGTQLCLALPQSLAPFVAAKQAAGDREGIRRLLMLCVKSGMALQLAYTVSVGLWAGALMQLWLGPGHFLGYGVLGFWLLASVLEFHHSIHAMFTFNVGEWPFAKWAVAAGVLNLLFVSLGLKAWGLAGAAAGCMAAQLLTNNWYVVYFTLRRLDLGLKRYIGQALIPLAGLVMTLWLAGRAIHPALEGLAWPARLVRGLALREAGPALAGPLVLATLALLILWLLLLDREERNLIFKKKEAL